MKPLLKFEIEPGVYVEVFPEDGFIQDFLTETDDPETYKQVEAGNWEFVFIAITVWDKSGHVKGLDSLGGVLVKPGTFEKEVRETIKTHGMINEAKADLALKLSQIAKANQS